MSSRTRLSILFISTPVLAFVVVGGLIGQERANDDQLFRHLRIFQEVVNLVKSNYVEEVEMDRALDGALRGLADNLDPDSAYLTASQARAVAAGESLPEGSVGLELTRQYYLRVIAARDGSPAAKAGLQTGDFIRAIDGKPTRDLSVFDGARLLLGRPGTQVTLTVIRGNAAEPHEVVLVREKPAGPLVTSRVVGEDIGYLRIVSFRNGVVDELRNHANRVASQGAASILIDLRRTAEGPLDNGLAAARLFVNSGTLGMRAGREASDRLAVTASAKEGTIDLPVTLLFTTGTSGAAELFIAALDGNDRAQLLGERTLGRVGVQKLVKIADNRALWLTHQRYLTPAGEPIHGRGIEPDVRLEEPSLEFGAAAPEIDPMLDAALDHIRATRRPAA